MTIYRPAKGAVQLSDPDDLSHDEQVMIQRLSELGVSITIARDGRVDLSVPFDLMGPIYIEVGYILSKAVQQEKWGGDRVWSRKCAVPNVNASDASFLPTPQIGTSSLELSFLRPFSSEKSSPVDQRTDPRATTS